ncbi:unnamed protein product [Rotaria sp. Silwood1]|nr:unnamed protein product [Rotaria sp. Silwood1]
MHSEDLTSTILSSNYSGAYDHKPLTSEEIFQLTNQQQNIIYGPTLFALKYRVLPCTVNPSIHYVGSNYNDASTSNSLGQLLSSTRGRQWSSRSKQGGMYHSTSVLHFIINEYKIDPNSFIYDWSYDTSDNSSLIAKIFHVPQTADRARTLLGQISKFKLFPITEATLQMVCHDAQSGFYTSSIRMKQPHITDLKLHYGDEFEIIHEQLLKTLQEKDSTGITLLHGPPGTGKTYYLRYLINEIKEKSLIYVPPDLVNEITKPGFLPFLMQYPNSILIVEDAENIIRDRIQNTILPSQAVANLLNLSDGLLGDAMHQQIICTFNCDVKGIDPALLRDGRLVVEHKFDKLSVEHARRMCVELGICGSGEDIHEPISLAEIYTRKNDAVANMANGFGNGHTTTQNKRPLKKKNQKTDPFLGFYS